MLGDDSNTEPPDSIPNSVVKRISGDGSVGLPHVRVAHRQAPNKTTLSLAAGGFLLCPEIYATEETRAKLSTDEAFPTDIYKAFASANEICN